MTVKIIFLNLVKLIGNTNDYYQFSIYLKYLNDFHFSLKSINFYNVSYLLNDKIKSIYYRFELSLKLFFINNIN